MIKILCTVGPSTINSLVLKKLEKERSLLRINLPHTNLDDLVFIEITQSNLNIPICMILKSQIRTGDFKGFITLNINDS